MDDPIRLSTAAKVEALRPHLPRILWPLDRMVADFTQNLHPKSPARAFLGAMVAEIDIQAYTAVQDEHLSLPVLEFLAGPMPPRFPGHKYLDFPQWAHKYLDFPYWASSKLGTARKLGLQEGRFRRILDIGSGAGHFGLAARYFGCDHLGLEKPLVPRGPSPRHLYDDLCPIFGVERITQKVLANTPVAVPGRFDLATCLMGRFPRSGLPPKEGEPPRLAPDWIDWGWNEWVFFLNQMAEDVMTERFLIYLQINRNLLSEEIVSRLKTFCLTADTERGIFTFDHTLDRAALLRSAQA